jgi:serine/threonine-protein kinase
MPYVAGGSLKARLTREPQLALEEAVRITRQIGEALSYAHAHGLVHCDVKPGNILLEDGHALLADFGIARVATVLGGAALSLSGVVVGTPEYMSPEQGSRSGTVDGRSDVYALACVLYEMLSGEPPFTGATAQAVIARHMHDEPRSLRVVRSTIPPHVEEAIRTGLAKVPADRFATASAFLDALTSEGSSTRTARVRRGRIGAWLVASFATLAGLGVWQYSSGHRPLDRNKVVLFPLTERGLSAEAAGTGYDVSVMVSAALEHAQPLRWIDGTQRLPDPSAASRAIVPAPELRRIAAAQGAGYYIDGAVVGGRDTTTVILRLHDVAGDSIVGQRSAGAPSAGATAVQLGLAAVTELLPSLVDPGRRVDLTSLTSRKASAIALWTQGEREYRRSRFRSALDFYQRAVAQDSLTSFAALKGAQAAGWLNLPEDGRPLVAAALAAETGLPSRHRALAHGLQAYWSGRADSALHWLTQAVSEAPGWAEAHMALGEVYYHLLPESAAPLDSLARAEFAAAARHDSGFAPPVFHLAEIAIRRGALTEASDLVRRFAEFQPDSARLRQLAIMHRCATAGAAAPPEERFGPAEPMDLLQVARSLAAGGVQPACAEWAYRRLLADTTVRELHWGALLGLNGVLVSQARYDDIERAIEQAAATGLGRAPALYFLDVLAGAPLDDRARTTDSIWRSRFGDHYAGVSPQTRWLVGAWQAHEGDTARLKHLHAGMQSDTLAAGLPFEAALRGHLALALGDTVGALASFSALRAEFQPEALEWGLVEPLALERILLARIALARRAFAEAHRLAALFDHPTPVAFVPFVPASLEIRRQAARALGRNDFAELYRSRLRRLQPAQLAAHPF